MCPMDYRRFNPVCGRQLAGGFKCLLKRAARRRGAGFWAMTQPFSRIRTFTMKYPILLVCLALAGCATPTPDTQWAPRTDANLKSDLAACQRDADNVDLQSLSTDARYGPAAAMARQIQNGDIHGLTMDDVYKAVRDSCMLSKGWKIAE